VGALKALILGALAMATRSQPLALLAAAAVFSIIFLRGMGHDRWTPTLRPGRVLKGAC
jgi:hypothetical protein